MRLCTASPKSDSDRWYSWLSSARSQDKWERKPFPFLIPPPPLTAEPSATLLPGPRGGRRLEATRTSVSRQTFTVFPYFCQEDPWTRRLHVYSMAYKPVLSLSRACHQPSLFSVRLPHPGSPVPGAAWVFPAPGGWWAVQPEVPGWSLSAQSGPGALKSVLCRQNLALVLGSSGQGESGEARAVCAWMRGLRSCPGFCPQGPQTELPRNSRLQLCFRPGQG